MRRLERVALLVVTAPFAAGLIVGADAAEPEAGEVVLTFADDRIIESSGLVARNGLVVTVNDSGDGNRVFAVDPATGETVGVTGWQGEAEDIEALAPAGKGEVWVGDIGDNARRRDAVEVARVWVGRGDQEVEAPTYDLAYPDGAHDAETLLAHPRTGRLYVVSKEFIGRIYAAPEQLAEGRRNRLTLLEEVLGLATDGAFLPDGKHLVVRNYAQAAFYTWPGLERVGTVALPSQRQGEGIAVAPNGDVLVSSEGAHTDVLRVALPDALRAQLAGGSAGPTEAPDDSRSEKPDDPAPEASDGRPLWPWAVGGLAGVVIVLVLLRSLRG